jgi:1-acyl-sn-glycerol-3-phosphate acyltransferase
MLWLRSLLFNAVFYLWTAFVCLGALPSLVMGRHVVAAVSRFWAQGLLLFLRLICRLDYRVEGAEAIPRSAAIIASKHQSAWDTFIFSVLLDDPAYVMKRELMRIPVWGWYPWAAKMIAVDRDGHAAALKRLARQAEAAAADGRQIIIFPQGTRVAPGERAPYLPGVQALYGRLGVPVVPVALDSGLYWGRRAFAKRPGTIRLRFLPAIPPGLKRADFARRLEETIETESDRLIAAAEASAPAPGVRGQPKQNGNKTFD